MKKLSVLGAFRFSEFQIRDCVPVYSFSISKGITQMCLKND
jgi:hypothetical protein